MLGAAASCMLELTPAAKVTDTAPSGTSARICSGSDGATAASSSNTPNAVAAPTIIRGDTRPSRLVVSAPDTDPTPIAIVISAYVVAVPCQVVWASSGISTWKLKESVPTTTIAPSGMHNA